jgi:uncharacterized protein with GYD domain
VPAQKEWPAFFIWRVAEEARMATYIALVNFTDQGVRYIRQTTERAKGLLSAASKVGVTIKDIYWTMGPFDALFIADAPDDETMTTLAISLGSLGSVRTQTVRAFSAEEMNSILGKLPKIDIVAAK